MYSPIIPETCPICNAPFKGGHDIPGNRMKEGLRVFYGCGASLSFKWSENLTLTMLLKGCSYGEDI